MAERGTESTKLDVAAEDLETELIQTKVTSAEELQGKADKYPDPPETTDFPGDLATYQKHMQAYLIQRADILGIVMESCKKCRSGGCKIDISCFLSGQRFKKCGACYRGKISCTNSAEAERLFLEHQRYLRMDQKNTIEYQNLQARIAAQAARKRSQTCHSIEQAKAAGHATSRKSISLPEEDKDSSIAYLRIEADGLASIADIGSGNLKTRHSDRRSHEDTVTWREKDEDTKIWKDLSSDGGPAKEGCLNKRGFYMSSDNRFTQRCGGR